MQLSTAIGLGVTWVGFGVSWLASHASIAQTPPDAVAATAVSAPVSGLPANMTWPTAAVGIAGSIVTALTIVQAMLGNKKALDESKADHERTKRRLKRVSKRLHTTRVNSHKNRNQWSEDLGELRLHDMDIAAAVNKLNENQQLILDDLGIKAHSAPTVLIPPKVIVAGHSVASSSAITPVPPLITTKPPETKP